MKRPALPKTPSWLRAKVITCIVAGYANMITLPAALAQPVRLDDRLTRSHAPQVQMQWRPMAAGAVDPGMEAQFELLVHLATAAQQGRRGRVVVVLERDGDAPLEAVWSGHGGLLDGRVVSGERAIIYTGVVAGPTLQGQLRMRLRSGAQWASANRRMQFHFEWEAD